MKISVIVPIHNSEGTIIRCLDSILSQTLSDIEIILVNNASTDRSEELCLAYAKSDDRIKCVSLDIPGVSNARNKGKAIAQGEFIAFVDSDDYIDPSMYEKLYNKASIENADVCMCGFDKIKGGETVPSGEKDLTDFAVNKRFDRFWYENIIMGSCCRAIYKNYLAQSVDFDTEIRFTEDLIFSLEILDMARKIAAVEEPLYHYVIEGSECRKYRKKDIWRDIVRANEREAITLAKYPYDELVPYTRFSAYITIYDTALAIDSYDSSLIKEYNKNEEIKKLNAKENYRAYLKYNDGKKARLKAFLYRKKLFLIAFLAKSLNKSNR